MSVRQGYAGFEPKTLGNNAERLSTALLAWCVCTHRHTDTHTQAEQLLRLLEGAAREGA